MSTKTATLKAKKLADPWDEQKKLIQKVVKLTVSSSCVLPILEDVMISEGFLTVTDLETTVSIPFDSDINQCIPANRFLDCIGMMGKPNIREVITETPIPILEHFRVGDRIYERYEEFAKSRYDRYLTDGHREVMEFPEWCDHYCTHLTESMIEQKVNTTYHLEMSEGKRVIKLSTESIEDFPRLSGMGDKDPEFQHIGTFGNKEMEYLATALKFVSKDELRPAMTGVFVGKDICATDAHKLYWHPIDPVMQVFIITAMAVKFLLGIGGTWEVYGDGTELIEEGEIKEVKPIHACFINESGVMVMTRVIDAKFPDYNVVIPQGECNYYLLWDSYALRKEVQNAAKFSDRSTSQVNFLLNGKASVSSYDIDFGFEYSNELVGAEVQKREGFINDIIQI